MSAKKVSGKIILFFWPGTRAPLHSGAPPGLCPPHCYATGANAAHTADGEPLHRPAFVVVKQRRLICATRMGRLNSVFGRKNGPAILCDGVLYNLFRNSQLSTLYSTVKSRTEMTIITTVRYQGNALTDTFNANRVGLQCLTLLVHTSTNS